MYILNSSTSIRAVLRNLKGYIEVINLDTRIYMCLDFQKIQIPYRHAQ